MTDLLAERRKSIELRLNGIPELVINQEGGKLEQFKTPSRFFGPRVSSAPGRLADAAMATGRAVAGGVQDAVKGVVSTADDIGTFIDEKTGGLGTIGEPTRMDEAFEQGLQNLNIKVPEGDSAIEQLGRGLVQFAAGMVAAPVKGAGLLANMGRGAFADALFDPEEGNLSTLLNEFDLGNAVTEYLDSSVDDEASAAERLSGRLKNSLEGAGLGAAIDTIVGGFRAARSDEGLKEAIKGKLQPVVDRLSQPGAMPITSSFGAGEIDDAVKKVELPTEDKPGIIAFHGSGADFDEFKIEKIGTGEGGQAFGYGLYFTDSEDIAKFYREATGAGNEVTYKGKKVQDLDEDGASYEENLAHMVGQQDSFFDRRRLIENEIARTRKSLSGIKQSIKDFQTNPKVYPLKYSGMTMEMNDAIGIKEFLETQLADAIEVEKNLSTIQSKPSGKIYKVGLNPTPEKLLDYDKPLGDQTDEIRSKLKKLIDNELNENDAVNLGFEDFEFSKAKANMLDENRSVVSFLNDWSVFRGEESTGEKLLEKYGIPGIKYKANQGVGARNVPETGTQNYVIFDDNLISILKKYGIVAPAAISTKNITQPSDTEGRDL